MMTREFEKWCADNLAPSEYDVIEYCGKAWQASREQLRLELFKILHPEGVKHPQQGELDSLLDKVRQLSDQADASVKLINLRNKVAKYESDHPWAKANQEVVQEAIAEMEKARALVKEVLLALQLADECETDDCGFCKLIAKAQAFMEGKSWQ